MEDPWTHVRPTETEPMKRPDDFRMAFNSKPDSDGIASIYVAAFGREHIPFLLKALRVADEILALDAKPAPTAKGEDDGTAG